MSERCAETADMTNDFDVTKKTEFIYGRNVVVQIEMAVDGDTKRFNL